MIFPGYSASWTRAKKPFTRSISKKLRHYQIAAHLALCLQPTKFGINTVHLSIYLSILTKADTCPAAKPTPVRGRGGVQLTNAGEKSGHTSVSL